jgi:hypothetical protein
MLQRMHCMYNRSIKVVTYILGAHNYYYRLQVHATSIKYTLLAAALVCTRHVAAEIPLLSSAITVAESAFTHN